MLTDRADTALLNNGPTGRHSVLLKVPTAVDAGAIASVPAVLCAVPERKLKMHDAAVPYVPPLAGPDPGKGRSVLTHADQCPAARAVRQPSVTSPLRTRTEASV